MSKAVCTATTLRTFTPTEALGLASGGSISAATIGYQTWGRLNAARDNAIWVCHALTASSDVESWWSGIFGIGKTLDPSRHFIVCANTLGSCYGSLGPDSINPDGTRFGSRFPEIEIGDIVEHQRLLADHLNIAGIELVIGASMGGFQALEWARREPKRVQRVALIASSWRQPPQALAQARLQCEFIRRDARFVGGDYHRDNGPDEGLALARQLGHLTYRSPDELDSRFGRERRADGHWQVLSYLDHQGEKLVRRFDALSYVRLTEAMNRYDFAQGGDLASALAALKQPVLVVSLSSDQLYYPSEQQRLSDALPNGRLLSIDTRYGHDGFLVESERLEPALRAFRDEPAADTQRLTRCEDLRETSDDARLPLVVIGASGRVGSELLNLLVNSTLASRIRLVGVSHSRGAIWHRHGLPIESAVASLRGHSSGSTQQLINRLIANAVPAIVVDCTASAQVAARTAELLSAGIGVVTPNKIAFAGASDIYRALDLALRQGAPAGWSATVGAGLPILSTIQRLREAGDTLLEVEAGLSGTLGHVLTRTQNGASLSVALREAVERGFAEPDPRLDLSGADVRRKLCIVLRAAGIECSPEQIALTGLLDLCETGDWQDAVAAQEHAWNGAVTEAKSASLRLVYRAHWRADCGPSVGLVLLPEDHPLSVARGTENRVVLRTLFHADQPIVIAGAGAGVRVTAAAVLADVAAVCAKLRTPSAATITAQFLAAQARKTTEHNGRELRLESRMPGIPATRRRRVNTLITSKRQPML